MDFKQIAAQRYATKKFDGRKVDEATMKELYDIIRLSASSFGLQPWKIKIVKDQKTKDALMAASWNQPQVGTCSHLLVICANTDTLSLIEKFKAEMKKVGVPQENIDGFSNMVSGFASNMPEEQKKIWAQKQCYIAMGNALNGAKSLGLDSCPMEGFDPAKYSEILSLPAQLVPTLVVPVGYAADTQRAKIRFSHDDIYF